MREMWEMWKFEAKPSWCQCWRIAQPVTWPSMPTCDILWPCCDRVSINSSWTIAQLITPRGVVSAAQPECKTTKSESTTFRTARATLEEKANQLGAQHLQLKLSQKSCFTVEISQVHWRKVQKRTANQLQNTCVLLCMPLSWEGEGSCPSWIWHRSQEQKLYQHQQPIKDHCAGVQGTHIEDSRRHEGGQRVTEERRSIYNIIYMYI